MIQWKQSTAYAVFLCCKEWKKTGMMLLMDVLFVGILFAAARMFDYMFTSNEAFFIGTWLGYGFLLLYFLIIVAAYSFFKYAVLQLMKSTELKIKITKDILQFFVYTLISAGILIVTFVVLATFFAVSLVAVVKQTALVLFIVLYGIGSYFFMSASHVLFMTQKPALKQIPKKVYEAFSWKFAVQWLGWNLLFVSIFAVIYFLLFLIVHATTENILLFVSMNIFVFIVLIIGAYFFLFWNRMYLFLRLKSAQKCDTNVPQPLKKK